MSLPHCSTLRTTDRQTKLRSFPPSPYQAPTHCASRCAYCWVIPFPSLFLLGSLCTVAAEDQQSNQIIAAPPSRRAARCYLAATWRGRISTNSATTAAVASSHHNPSITLLSYPVLASSYHYRTATHGCCCVYRSAPVPPTALPSFPPADPPSGQLLFCCRPGACCRIDSPMQQCPPLLIGQFTVF
jgi:hypothetical protein